MITTYLSLGSNIDDRIEHLSQAESKLSAHPKIEVVQLSKIYETEPLPLRVAQISNDQFPMTNSNEHPTSESGEKWFLNQVLEIKTSLSPDELLDFSQQIEKELGRESKGDYTPRTIDIDILLYDNQVIESDHHTIPHHHMVDRQFVLVPLLEIAPDLMDPNSEKPFKYFLQNIKDDHKVEAYL